MIIKYLKLWYWLYEFCFFSLEELVEIDTFYDDYRQKKIETVVVVDHALLPKEKEHWGYDTVGEGMWVLIVE